MSTSKHFDKICCIILAVIVLLAALFMNGEAFGIQPASRVMGYENRLFDYQRVHTIDIVAENWEEFLATCTDEEYITCAAVIDGEAYKNIAIRAKGNTSLSSVKNYGNNRYSFKIEFDHYDSSLTYHGLDKLCLNNIIQDNTYMKDFLVYQMMNKFGVNAPLCSFAYITVNGEDWGLYLAVEAVEESFLQRNYGADYGELYKPDSMSFGGGRGNGAGFDMDKFREENSDMFGDIMENLPEEIAEKLPEDFDISDFDPSQFGGMTPPDFGNGGSSTTAEEDSSAAGGSDPSQFGGNFTPPTGEKPQGNFAPPTQQNNSANQGENQPAAQPDSSENTTAIPQKPQGSRPEFGGRDDSGRTGGHGMGSNDAKLQYIDDNPDSYSAIFSSAKTDVSDSDKQRLISALKQLSEGDSSVVFTEEAIRYFVAHNFVCNGDSYTGNMIHNYYLYEEDGQLAMLPWDYNLAFGGFDGGSADSAVNAPIDTPVNGGIGEDRPMISWIFKSEQYTEQYHEYFSQFITELFESGWAVNLIDSTAELISPYVEKDPTKFCTSEQFQKGVSTLREFITLRAESISGQLDGSIPSTSEGQSGSTALVDASSITISDMGSMGMGGGHGGMNGGNKGDFGGFGNRPSKGEQSSQPSDTDIGTGEQGEQSSSMQQNGGTMNVPPTNNDTVGTADTETTEIGSTAAQPENGTAGTPPAKPEGEMPSGLPSMQDGDMAGGFGNGVPPQGGFGDMGAPTDFPTQPQ